MTTSTEPDAQIDPVALERPRRRRLIGLLVAAVVAGLLIVLTMAGVAALDIRRDLVAGRDALTAGRSSLLDGDATGAEDAFSRAAASFRAGADGSRSIWLSIVGSMPFVGRTPDAVRAVADAGVETARAAQDLSAAVAALPDGLGSLAPTAAGIPVERLAGLADAVAGAEARTRLALRTLQSSPSGFVLPAVAAARADALDELERVHRQLVAGAAILRGLPSFLGSDGPRHYFFGASNPAELRGTGGLIGAYAILTIDHGRLSFSDFRPMQSLPLLNVSEVPSPSPEYSTNFDYARSGLGFWVNINMTPDFPLAARAMWLAYRAAEGRTLDGVIVADPFALKALMHVTDPIKVGSTGPTLNEHTIVPFTTNEAYALFDTNEERKLVLGRVAQAVFNAFLSQQGDDLARVRALLHAFADGHVKVWTRDEAFQEGLLLTSVGGAYRPTGTDSISVITNSASGTKLDFYQERTVSYEVRLAAAGTATATLDASLKNDSPTTGYPHYVIGPYKHYSTQAGENVAVVDLYCGRGCVLDAASRNGAPVELDRHEQQGYPFFEDYVRTPSGETADVTAQLVLPDAWVGDEAGGTYRLSFFGQSTIRPTTVRVTIHAPAGMRFTSWDAPLHRDGGVLVYEGTASGNLELDATFAPPLLHRLWQDLVRAVT